MINTGWIGGAYGVGSRIQLKYTRAIIRAVLEQQLNNVEYKKHPVFNMMMPCACPGVPKEILNPRNTWSDKNAYDEQAKMLADLFVANFKEYAERVGEEILSAAPISNL